MALLMYAEMCSFDNESEELVKIRIPGRRNKRLTYCDFYFGYITT